MRRWHWGVLGIVSFVLGFSIVVAVFNDKTIVEIIQETLSDSGDGAIGPLGDESSNSPGTTTNVDDAVGWVWTNIDNSQDQDDTYASITRLASGHSDFIYAYNFGFSLPTDATIVGIKFEIDKYANNNAANHYVVDRHMYIVDADGASGTDKADTGTKWPKTDTDTYVSYGGAEDNWGGELLTGADVNDADFGCKFSCDYVTPLMTAVSPFVDHIRVIVYYSEANVNPSLSNPVPANNSINVELTPDTNITVNDTDADTMNLSWYSDFTETTSFSSSYVNSSKSDYATRMPHERTRFYANGSFWFFYGLYLGTAGSNNKIVYKTSTDGITWSAVTEVRDSFYNAEYGSHGLAGFSIWLEEDTDDIHYTYAQYENLSYRKGHLCSNGTITWYAAEHNLGSVFPVYAHANIALNSSGYPWIWVQRAVGIHIFNSSTKDGTWTNTSGSGNTLNFDNVGYQGMVIPLPNDKMIAVTSSSGNKVTGIVWNGTAWEDEINLSSGLLSSQLFAQDWSMLSFDEHLFILYRETSTEQLRFRHINTTDWSMDDEIYITANIPDKAYGVLSYDRAKEYVYCIWESVNKTYYRRVSGINFTTMENTVEWFSWANLFEGRLSVSWADYDGRIVIGFMNTTVDNYNAIYMNYINTTDWKLYGTETNVNNGSYEKEYTDATHYGVRYRWKVHSNDSLANISEIYYFTTKDYTTEPPSSFSATAVSSSQINLTWTDSLGTDSTRVEWNPTADATWDVSNHTLLYNDSTEHYEHSGLDLDEDYFYKAWSWNSTQGVWSQGVTDDATTLNISWVELHSGYLTGGNNTVFKEILVGWVIGGNTTIFNELYTGWLKGGNITDTFNELHSGYLTGGNITTDFTEIFSGYLTGGDDSQYEELFSGWLIGGNVTEREWKETYSGWLTGGNITDEFVEIYSGWLAGGNTTDTFTEIHSGYLTGGDDSQYEELFSGWLTGGNTTVLPRNWSELLSGWLTGGNTTTILFISNENPINESSMQSEQPLLYFTLINPLGYSMNYSIFVGNSTQNATYLLTNVSSVSNGTFFYSNYTNATDYGINYYWRVYVNDSVSFVNETFHFVLSYGALGYIVGGSNAGVIAFAVVGLLLFLMGIIITKRRCRDQ